MRKNDLLLRSDPSRALGLLLRCALVYLLADLPVQLTGFLSFGSGVGIKNFLPATLGLLFGPYGALGGLLGCTAGALLLGSPAAEYIAEAGSILITAMGMWICWHIGSSSHRIHFKRPVHYAKYLLLLALFSAAGACISLLTGIKGAFLTLFCAQLAMGALIGIPVNILLNSMLCIEPVLPPWCAAPSPVCETIDADPQSFAALSDRLEEFAFEKRIGMKRLFEIQSCIEELYLRILAAQPQARLLVRIDFDDTLSARICYSGGRYNPLRSSKEDDELDQMGLKLIKHRALRAAWSYRRGENRILIVT